MLRARPTNTTTSGTWRYIIIISIIICCCNGSYWNTYGLLLLDSKVGGLYEFAMLVFGTNEGFSLGSVSTRQ